MMKPVLASMPQKRRNVLFVPAAFGMFLVVFLILGFALDDVFYPLVIAAPLAVAGAWALFGWPVVTRKDGKPLVEEKWKPFLFFPLALVFALVAYPILGVFLTKAGTPPKWLAPASILIAAILGCAAAYVLVGFPHVIRAARHAYEEIPPERRPFLFFPVFAVTFLILYIGLGVGFTELLGKFEDKVVFLLNIQVLLLLPVTLILAALVAFLLVGFPKPQRPPSQYLPKVTGKHRPRAFLLTLLLAGIPLTVIVGFMLTAAAKTNPRLLPDELLLPLALVLGYSLSLGVAAAVWGTPARWRRFDDYQPGLSPRARVGAAGAAGFATLLAVTVGFGIAGVDLFWGLLVGLLLGGVLTLVIAGAHRRIAERKGEPTLLPDLPDRAKSLVIFTTWLVLALVIFSVTTYALPDLIAWNALLAVGAGLVVAFVLVEQGLVQRMLAQRRAEREKRKAWQKRRKEALARGSLDEREA